MNVGKDEPTGNATPAGDPRSPEDGATAAYVEGAAVAQGGARPGDTRARDCACEGCHGSEHCGRGRHADAPGHCLIPCTKEALASLTLEDAAKERARSLREEGERERPNEALPTEAEGKEAVERLGIDVKSWATDVRARVARATKASANFGTEAPRPDSASPDVLERFNRCVWRIWEMFPSDPLGDDPAHFLVERLEALLDRGLIAPRTEPACSPSGEWGCEARRLLGIARGGLSSIASDDGADEFATWAEFHETIRKQARKALDATAMQEACPRRESPKADSLHRELTEELDILDLHRGYARNRGDNNYAVKFDGVARRLRRILKSVPSSSAAASNREAP